MGLLVFQHHPTETPSRFGTILNDHGHKLRIVRLDAGEPVPPDLDDVDGIISMGGPQNVDEAAKYPWLDAEIAFLKAAHTKNKPMVGICLGAQLIAVALGGKVAAMATPEVGWQSIRLGFPGQTDPLYQGITWDSMQFHLHGQEVTALPAGGTPLAGSKGCKTQAYKVGLTTYAFQYHFEWTQADLNNAVRDPLFEKAGGKADAVAAQTAQFYDDYRRRGDRISEMMALLLFPLDKRR